MGCSTSKDVMSRIKDQEKKIDDLITINQQLQSRLGEMHRHQLGNGSKNGNETNSDLTSLRTTIDLRFTKLEKTVERIHNDFKSKMFDDNGIEIGQAPNTNNALKANEEISLSLELSKDIRVNEIRPAAHNEWNDLLHDETNNNTPLKMPTVNQFSLRSEEKSANNKADMMKNYEKVNNENDVDHEDIKMDIISPEKSDNHKAGSLNTYNSTLKGLPRDEKQQKRQ